MILDTMDRISHFDPEVGASIREEYGRERRNIELIASENMVSEAVMLAMGTCLTCHHLGQRLGQGGGYYDRFLAHYRGGAVLLCRELLIREEIPLEPHDYPVPWVLTEKGLYEDGVPARLG